MNSTIKFYGIIRRASTNYAINFPALPDPIILTTDSLGSNFRNKLMVALAEYFESNTIRESELDRELEKSDTCDDRYGDLVGTVSCEAVSTDSGEVKVAVGDFPE